MAKSRDEWNEFRWEREIRRDERRIACYFRELPSCLDLPGEEELISGQLAENQNPVPSGATVFRSRRLFERQDFDDEDDNGELPRRPGSELVEALDYLASEWNILMVSRLRADLRELGLGLACAYAKLLSRAADFADADPESALPLKLSLGKRVLTDLSETAGRIDELSDYQHSLAASLAEHRTRLAEVRERTVDLLTALRQNGR